MMDCDFADPRPSALGTIELAHVGRSNGRKNLKEPESCANF